MGWKMDLVNEAKDDEWAPLADELKPDFYAMDLPEDPAREFDPEEVVKFFELYADGCGEFEIGLSLNWSPATIKKFVGDPGRAELMNAVRERDNESVERAVHRAAVSGNVPAMKLWLFSKAAHRGWADRRHVRLEAHSQREIIFSVRQALDEKTRDLVMSNGEEGIAALQAAMLDDDVIEAELVDDGD